jgi:hypothetical protein
MSGRGDMRLLGVLEDCGDYETGWHSFLAPDRMRGEWFAWSKAVETTVKLAIDGGDWRTAISLRRKAPIDDWFIGGPLYDPRPAPPTPYLEMICDR